jgi:hypothetical protein
MVDGEAGRQVTVVPLPGRRTGLEDAEQLLATALQNNTKDPLPPNLR